VTPVFDAEFRAQLLSLFEWRRDVRRFRRDAVPDGTLARLVGVAGLAPSVGLSEPWRFVSVRDPARRAAVRQSFEACNRAALENYDGDRAALYAQLKLAGLDSAPVQFALFADHGSAQGHGLGRRTMPETLDYSAVTAVHTLWLAARAEGLGVGWVSIVDAAVVARALDVPADWHFIGYFCLGYPAAGDDTPALERAGWETRVGARAMLVDR